MDFFRGQEKSMFFFFVTETLVFSLLENKSWLLCCFCWCHLCENFGFRDYWDKSLRHGRPFYPGNHEIGHSWCGRRLFSGILTITVLQREKCCGRGVAKMCPNDRPRMSIVVDGSEIFGEVRGDAPKWFWNTDPYHPCIVYLPPFGSIWLIFMVNVGRYTSPMDSMCEVQQPRFWLARHFFHGQWLRWDFLVSRAKKQQENNKKTTWVSWCFAFLFCFCVLYSGGFVWPFQNVSSSTFTFQHHLVADRSVSLQRLQVAP